MIPESDIEKAVDYLRSSAQEAAQARANVRYLDSYLKVLKAQLKGQHSELSNAAAEDAALASPEYRSALEGYRVALEKDALHSFKRDAAAALIEAWRTQCANQRIEGRAYGP